LADEKRSRLYYWGETLREYGILISVFGPMYLRFEAKEAGPSLLLDSGGWVICGIIMIVIGVELERRF
jgi:hypothetical protein